MKESKKWKKIQNKFKLHKFFSSPSPFLFLCIWRMNDSRTSFNMGNSGRVKFWKDKWNGDSSLRGYVLSLQSIVVTKDVRMADVWGQQGEDELASQGTKGMGNEKDQSPLLWGIKARLGVWMRKTRWIRWMYRKVNFRSSVYTMSLQGKSGKVPNEGYWNVMASTKVRFFEWEAYWEKVLTLDRLQRRGWSLLNWCFIRKEDEELVDHILLHFFELTYHAIWCFPYLRLLEWCQVR